MIENDANRILRYIVAEALLTNGGSADIKEGAWALLHGIPSKKIDGPRSLPALAGLFTPPITPEDLEAPLDAARRFVDEALRAVKEAAEQARKDPPPPTEDESAPPPSANYRLELRIKRVKCNRITAGGDDTDEFLISGGYTYGSGGRGHLQEYRQDFKNGTEFVLRDKDVDFTGDPEDDPGPEHVLKNVVVVPLQKNVEFHATLLCWEVDWVEPSTATGLGIFLSLLLSAGLTAAADYLLTAPGLPSELTEQAKDLLREHGIKGIRSWFEQLVGPEAFQPLQVKAVTDWEPDSSAFHWDSWITLHPRTFKTTPFRSNGPSLHKGRTVTTQEIKFAEGSQGTVVERVVPNGGLYEIDMLFELVS